MNHRSKQSPNKKEWLAAECGKDKYRSPCDHFQKWECVREDGDGGELRLRKCRNGQHGFGSFRQRHGLRPQQQNSHFQRSRTERRRLVEPTNLATTLPDELCTCKDSDNSDPGEQVNDDALLPVYQELKQLPGALGIAGQGGVSDLKIERRLQRRFLALHVNSEFKPIFIKKQARRNESKSVQAGDEEERDEEEHAADTPSSSSSFSTQSLDDSLDATLGQFDVDGVFQLNRLLDIALEQQRRSKQVPSAATNGLLVGNYSSAEATNYEDDIDDEKVLEGKNDEQHAEGDKSNLKPTGQERAKNISQRRPNTDRITSRLPPASSGCTLHINSSVSCPKEVYLDKMAWRRKKDRLDDLIKKLQSKLFELKDIRRHLKKSRPDITSKTCDCSASASNEQSNGRRQDSKFGQMEPYESRDRDNRRHGHAELRVPWQRKRDKKLRRKAKFENYTACNLEKMNCFTHDNNHWRTAPFWTS